MRRTRLLVADNHGIVVKALGSLLQRDYEVLGTVGEALELAEAARRLSPDVIVADLDVPGLSGLEALRRLSVQKFEAKVVFLTMHCEPELAAEAFQAGGAGYVLKQSAIHELHTAIQEVLKGRAYLASRITASLFRAIVLTQPPQDRRRRSQRKIANAKTKRLRLTTRIPWR
jgi:DNA-binding NarL/FixJ family response regulator